jgi:hypothetical protein
MSEKLKKEAEIIKMGNFSFELEEKREQSLLTQSGYMLTGFSIVSVMLLAAIPILLENTNISNRTVLILIGISLLFLILSLLSTIVAQWRYKSVRLNNVELIYNLMIDMPLKDFNYWWLDNLDNLHNEKNRLNDKRADWMKISTISFGISISTILIYLIILLIIM